MRRLHFVTGVCALLAFLASGAYMQLAISSEFGASTKPLVCSTGRSAHLSAVHGAVLNLALEFALNRRVRGWLRFAGRICARDGRSRLLHLGLSPRAVADRLEPAIHVAGGRQAAPRWRAVPRCEQFAVVVPIVAIIARRGNSGSAECAQPPVTADGLRKRNGVNHESHRYHGRSIPQLERRAEQLFPLFFLGVGEDGFQLLGVVLAKLLDFRLNLFRLTARCASLTSVSTLLFAAPARRP